MADPSLCQLVITARGGDWVVHLDGVDRGVYSDLKSAWDAAGGLVAEIRLTGKDCEVQIR